jgi:hypothetical protein
VVAYGWYSNQPTDIDGLELHFSPDYMYMYSGYTHPRVRGLRLHAIGMNRALAAYLERGHKGLISYVESHNYRSLQSVYRMGYEDIGRVVILKLGKLPLMFASRGCREHDFVITRPTETVRAEPVAAA